MASAPRTSEVGIDTLHLLVEDAESLQQLRGLNRAALRQLHADLKRIGIHLKWYRPKWKQAMGRVGEREFSLQMSVAEVANRLQRSPHRSGPDLGDGPFPWAHNSYLATYAEMLQVLALVKGLFERAGVVLKPGQLKVTRLDLFIDALLTGCQGDCEAFKMVLLMAAACSRIRGGEMYETGLNGYNGCSAWILYGKGEQLLQRADEEGWLSLLLEERSAREWRSFFRLEVRWINAAAVKRALPPRVAPPSGQENGSENDGELPSPRVLVSELLERWDELPALYAATAQQRCLRWSSQSIATAAAKSKMAQRQSVQASRRGTVQSKRSLSRASKRPLCPVGRVLRRLHRAVGEGADWSYIESLIPPLSPKGKRSLPGLKASSARRFRLYLKTLPTLRAQRVSALAKDFERALVEREATCNPRFLNCYRELEEAFGLHRCHTPEDASVIDFTSPGSEQESPIAVESRPSARDAYEGIVAEQALRFSHYYSHRHHYALRLTPRHRIVRLFSAPHVEHPHDDTSKAFRRCDVLKLTRRTRSSRRDKGRSAWPRGAGCPPEARWRWFFHPYVALEHPPPERSL